jgi:TetR/AcrR family transcriptional regulator, transcriptional repressor for nem operon
MNESKEHILKIGFMLFLQKSFKEVTMKEIVEKTGLSKGAFYHYFQSKEQLFQEILNNFFAAIMNYDFDKLNNESLYEFYNDHCNKLNTMRFQFLENKDNNSEDFLNLNFFSLLFDAFKLFPEFRSQMEIYHKKEMDSWVGMISKARKKGEIKSPLSDLQIAQIFLFTSDGLAMNLTMSNNTNNIQTDLKSIWDNFFLTIKH